MSTHASDVPAPWKSRNLLLLLALLAIGLVFEYFTHDAENSFLSARSISTIFMQASVIGVLACGMTFIIILTHIDLSVGSAIAFLGGMAAWMMAAKPEPVDPDLAALGLGMGTSAPSGLGMAAPLALLLTLLLGLMLWTGKGVLQTWTGMPAFVITLGGMLGYRGLAYLIVKREIPIPNDSIISRIGTGYLEVGVGWLLLGAILASGVFATIVQRRRHRIYWYTAWAPAVLIGSVVLFLQLPHSGVRPDARGLAYLTCIWAAAALGMSYLSTSTVFGRHMIAAGGNREAARLCGIRVKRVTIIAFAIMGGLTALASIMYLGQQGTAESAAGNLAELDAIAACVIGGVSLMGGKGTISGAVLGALIMQSLTAGLYQCNVSSGYQMVIKAIVLIAVVALDHLLRRD